MLNSSASTVFDRNRKVHYYDLSIAFHQRNKMTVEISVEISCRHPPKYHEEDSLAAAQYKGSGIRNNSIQEHILPHLTSINLSIVNPLNIQSAR